ncbi:MAG: hypothetical protein BWY99_02350 [Synergistetes bacterium ADurb.BinA166]|jgi:hypothetical protein|nr:MAG: hypothetical protein BWY99_02350 [Synergistetes bacterium ADurb.BinA166]
MVTKKDIMGTMEHRITNEHISGQWTVWDLTKSEMTCGKYVERLKRDHPGARYFMRSRQFGVLTSDLED